VQRPQRGQPVFKTFLFSIISSTRVSEMTLTEAITTLEAYFDKNGWSYDMNAKKLWERSSLSSETHKAGWDIVEIERHRGVLGASYTKGFPLSAMQTYWQRYAIHIADGSVEELSEKTGLINVDISSLVDEGLGFESFDLKINPLQNGKYLISESISSQESEILTAEEAKVFALGVVEGWNDYFNERLSEIENLTKEDMDRLLRAHKKCLEEGVINKVVEVWDSKEKYEED